LGDLLVAQVLRRHVRNAPLAGGQRVGATEKDRPGMGAGRRQLVDGSLHERDRAAAMGQLDPLAEKLPRLGATTVAAAEQRAQIDEGACVLEAGRRVRECFA